MAGSSAQKSRDRPPQAGPDEPQAGHPDQPPNRSHAMQPHQPRHAAYGEPLPQHAPVRPRPRRALVVRSWYQKKRFALPLAALLALVVVVGINGARTSTPSSVAGVPVVSAAAGSTPSVESAAAPLTVSTSIPTPTPTRKATKKAAVEQVEIGDSVTAGDWQLKVTDFDCGENEIGDEDRSTKAEGEFCLLEIRAKNNSDTKSTVADDQQKLSDDGGETYRSDHEATLDDDPGSNLFVDGVDPGSTAKGTVVFDVPKKVRITEVIVTGGDGSTGKATISLR